MERRVGVWVKRDDTYEFAGQRGGKVRTCRHLAGDGGAGLITAGSRKSPQVEIVSGIARHLGVPCRVHVPTGADTPQTLAAIDNGAEVVRHKPGYNSVIVARARRDAHLHPGWVHIPFGMETRAAVEQTASEVWTVIDVPWKRLVVPVGSGMSLAGILHGLATHGDHRPVIGVQVGADPTQRLDRYAPIWRFHDVDLVQSEFDYHRAAPSNTLDGMVLDPIYEAKCLPYLEYDDLFWVVGIRDRMQ